MRRASPCATPAGDVVLERSWPAGGLRPRRGHARTAAGRHGSARAASTRSAVGHRVVHGGMSSSRPVRVDDGVLAELDRLIPLAPLHQPHNLAPIRAIAAHAPHLPQVACFDTAFHRSQPRVAQSFALPRRYYDDGVRRYGFHGLSYEFIAARLRDVAPDIAQGRVIVAHLGNGASLCGIHDGRSVASTMGFTAVDGLMMGTRCGALDPARAVAFRACRGHERLLTAHRGHHERGLVAERPASADRKVGIGTTIQAAMQQNHVMTEQ